MSEKLRTGHPDNGKHSNLKAYIKIGTFTKHSYSLPHYDQRGDGKEKLMEYIERANPDMTLCYIYDLTEGRKSFPVCFWDAKELKWKPWSEHVATSKPTPSVAAAEKPKSNLLMWIPLKKEYQKGSIGKVLHSIDIDPDTAEVYEDYEASLTLIEQYKSGGWREMQGGTPKLYRNGEKNAVAFFSNKYVSFFEPNSSIVFGKSKKLQPA